MKRIALIIALFGLLGLSVPVLAQDFDYWVHLPIIINEEDVTPTPTATLTPTATNTPSSTPDASPTATHTPTATPNGEVVPGTCLSAAEAELAQLLNDYRQQNGLTAVPVSQVLTEVAQWHVWDLVTNSPDAPAECNLHSWSDARPDLWSAVCYTPDHANAEGMWDKPEEISNGAYQQPGYEISVRGSGTLTAEQAFNAWLSSAGHLRVILEQDPWDQVGGGWPAMGVGMRDGYAVVWYSTQADTSISTCQ